MGMQPRMIEDLHVYQVGVEFHDAVAALLGTDSTPATAHSS